MNILKARVKRIKKVFCTTDDVPLSQEVVFRVAGRWAGGGGGSANRAGWVGGGKSWSARQWVVQLAISPSPL